MRVLFQEFAYEWGNVKIEVEGEKCEGEKVQEEDNLEGNIQRDGREEERRRWKGMGKMEKGRQLEEREGSGFQR